MTDREQRIGFIGTGNIGNPMARSLIRAGHQLVVHDARPEAIENLLELGAEPADSPAEVAGRCSVVFTSLPGAPQLSAVVEGGDGLLAGASPGDIHVDLSTKSVSGTARLLEREAAAGVVYLDCPVTGGVIKASDGTLTVLGSGDPDAFEQVRPMLEAIGDHVLHLGDSGMGVRYKLVNNTISLCGHMIVQEALVLGKKAGLDLNDLVEKLRAGTARPFMGAADIFLERDFEDPTSTLTIGAKDVTLALDFARELAVPMPAVSAAHQTYLRALAAGYEDLAHYTTILALEAAAGIDPENGDRE